MQKQKKFKIIITGGSGFIGKHLNLFLSKNKNMEIISISSKDADLRNTNSLTKYETIKFDKIYHLAAWTEAGDFALHHPGEQWVNNQLINSNILRWWVEKQNQAKLISIGTSCAYAESSTLEEKNYLEGKPIGSLFAYAMSKRMLLIGQQNLAKQFGLNFSTYIPSTIYGPGYNFKDKIPHFIFDIIKKILIGKKYNKEVELWGDGSQKRELIHVTDFINQMLLTEDMNKNDILNIGGENEFEIKYYAKIICNIAGFDFNKIFFNTNKYVGSKSKNLNIKKLRSLLPNYTTITLQDGLRETVLDLYKQI
jgi:GDP-L-fucose synthase